MLVSQLFSGILFYVIFSLFAFIGLFFTGRIFSGRVLSYISAKPLGLVLFAYLIWILGFFRIWDYQWKGGMWALFVIGSVAAGYASRHHWKSLRPSWKKIALAEILTLLAFILYLYIRSSNATSSNGAESFMDITLLGAATKTHFFPFLDSWYAGKTVNYYYYGSYLMSLLGNLANINYYTSYNLSLGLIYCQSIILSGSLVYALSKSKLASTIGAFLISTAGTAFFAACVIKSPADHMCSYASSTRLFSPSYIINEIPSYSFVVGDLHAHLMALPFFLLNLILLFSIARLEKPRTILFVVLALTFATSAMINVWDGITLLCLFVILILIKFFSQSRQRLPKPRRCLDWLGFGLGTLAGTLALMSPAIATFKSPVLGLGYAPLYVAYHHLTDVQYPTPFLALLGIWGLLVIGSVISFIWRRKLIQHGAFALGLFIISLGIIVGVELFFIKDIYSVSNPPYFRANTTFKFGYHAWTMLSVLFAALLGQWLFPKIKEQASKSRIIPGLFFAAAIFTGMYFPYQALAQYYAPNGLPRDLDSSLWLMRQTPDDYAAIQYINQNLKDRMIIAEAVGDSYTTYGRVSAYTGMITPMGWKTHEWTWRFEGRAAENAPKGVTVETGYGPVAKVADDINRLYVTQNTNEALEIIKRYNIQYVFVGAFERSAYQNLDENKFDKLGEVVFQSGDTRLYKINFK